MSENVTRISSGDKEIILIGTAHVSPKSVEEVREVIETEKPDTVCVELDEQRYQAVMNRKKWQETDIIKIIKEKKATFLLINLVLSSYQKRLAKQFNINPGQEMIQGIQSAREIGAELVLADRDIRVTFSRIWRGLSLWNKLKLLFSIVVSIFSDETITEEELEKLKSQDILDAVLSEFTSAFPQLRVPLLDERDQYLAQKIKEAPGRKIVAVLGAAHVAGVKKEINREHDLSALSSVPPGSRLTKAILWLIPLLIIGIIVYTFLSNPSAGIYQVLSWVLWNGSIAAIGAALAFAHPLAIATAFVVSPISSLNPLLAAGWFAGLVQVFVCRPSVEAFENLAEDVLSLKGFWTNKVTRVLLVIALTNVGSTAGAFLGGADVLRVFLENL
ncbi:MAG TPA: TraB/GumN family protein [Bacillota bacterium]|nr:TraB/GumN family protein [Bacillota bacterium]HQD06171.1 TraB/GumN family protein [Bacillota bacterium]